MVVLKREVIAQGLEEIIVSLHAKGISSVADIYEQVGKLCNFDVSTAAISLITGRMPEDIVAWQNGLVEAICPIVWMGDIVFKVRNSSKVINKTVYIAVCLKEILGIWLAGLHKQLTE